MRGRAALLAVTVLLFGSCSADQGADVSGPPASAPTPPSPAASSAATTLSTTTTFPSPTTSRTGVPDETAGSSYVPEGVDPESRCLEGAVFGEPAESPYLLPYHPGRFYQVTQSYCFAGGGHRNQLAYDFAMPVGHDVLAARGGEVMDVRESSPDDGRGAGEHNYVFIRHDDGTVAFYAHLMRDGVVVEPGDVVVAGRVIALSGNSGLTGSPHLHFGVYRWWPPQEGFDVAVNFSNALGRLDPRGGLLMGAVYEALPAS